MLNNLDSSILQGALREKQQISIEITELQKQIQVKQEKIVELEVIIKYIQSHLPNISETAPPVEKEQYIKRESPPLIATGKEPSVSFIDGTIKILQAAGGALHITTILSEMERRFGRVTNARNLSGNIGKDSLKRFKNLGGNTWDLSSRHAPAGEDDKEENRSGVAARTTTPLFSSDKGGN